MSVVVITAPQPIITLAEAKKHVRFSAFDDDPYLNDTVASVTDYLDGPKGRLGRAIGAQTLEERRHIFPGPFMPSVWDALAIPRWCWHPERFIVQVPPIVSLVSVTYTDPTGTDQTIDLTTLAFDEDKVEPDYDTGGWPVAQYALNSVRLQYQAGYEVVPPAIKRAALLMVGTLYADREASPDTVFAGAAMNLLSPYAKIV